MIYERPLVKIHLGRRLLSVILTTLMPTLIVMVAALSTNYYKDEHFKTIIPVNLTSLLLMVTLYVGVSGRLPQTSYVKIMDVWMIFVHFIPFINIIMHGYLETLRTHLKTGIMDPDKTNLREIERKVLIFEKIQQQGLPIICLLFIVGFFSYGILSNFNEFSILYFLFND